MTAEAHGGVCFGSAAVAEGRSAGPEESPLPQAMEAVALITIWSSVALGGTAPGTRGAHASAEVSGGRTSSSPWSAVIVPRISNDDSGRSMEVGNRIPVIKTTPDISEQGSPAKGTTAMSGARARILRGKVKSRAKLPWRAMAAAPAAWACVFANIGATVGINVVMTWIPTYFEEFFLVDLRDLGIVSLVRVIPMKRGNVVNPDKMSRLLMF